VARLSYVNGRGNPEQLELDSAGSAVGVAITLAKNGLLAFTAVAGLDDGGLVDPSVIPAGGAVPDYSEANEGDVLTIVAGVPTWAPA
jgi:hypothetical protein